MEAHSQVEFRPEPGNRDSLTGLTVKSVFQDRSGELWVASDLSVDRYDPATERFAHFPSEPGMLEGPIHHINQDSAGRIWLATAYGLTGIEPASGRRAHYLDAMTAVLRSTFEEKDGTFWVADKEAVNIFDRARGTLIQRYALRSAASGRPLNRACFHDLTMQMISIDVRAD